MQMRSCIRQTWRKIAIAGAVPGLKKLPEHIAAHDVGVYLAARGTEGTIWGDGDGVDVASVASEG